MNEYNMIGLKNKIVSDYLDNIKNNEDVDIEIRYRQLLWTDLIESVTNIHKMILDKISEKIADDIVNQLFESIKKGGEE